jgi:hypothetical protein
MDGFKGSDRRKGRERKAERGVGAEEEKEGGNGRDEYLGMARKSAGVFCTPFGVCFGGGCFSN